MNKNKARYGTASTKLLAHGPPRHPLAVLRQRSALRQPQAPLAPAPQAEPHGVRALGPSGQRLRAVLVLLSRAART
jgi:hypothetical protein